MRFTPDAPPVLSSIVNRKSEIGNSEPRPKKALPRPPIQSESDCASRAAQMTDAMLAALLAIHDPQSSILAQTRTAFVSYCRAHPALADVRTAWASFHAELKEMLRVEG